jgi:transposase
MKTPGSTEERERRRWRAMALVKEGFSAAAVADRLGVDPRTVRRWKRAYRRGGKAALKVQKAPGAKPRLTGRQRYGLRRKLLAGAVAQGFTTELWTCPRIRQIIQRCYGVTYHVDHIPRLMQSLGFSPQKPERRARERNDAAIAEWIEREWPRIKKKPPASGLG